MFLACVCILGLCGFHCISSSLSGGFRIWMEWLWTEWWMSTLGVLKVHPFLFNAIYCPFFSYILSLSLFPPPPHLLLWESRLVFWTKSNHLRLWRRKVSLLEIGSACKSMGLSTHMSHLHTHCPNSTVLAWWGLCVCVCKYWCTFIAKVDGKEMEKYVRHK